MNTFSKLLAQVATTEEQFQANLPFTTNLSGIMTFMIRLIFVIAGIAALFFLLWGAVQWVTSGGEKEGIEKARNRIVAAVVGLLMLAVVVFLIVFIEKIVFNSQLCLGVSCPIKIGGSGIVK